MSAIEDLVRDFRIDVDRVEVQFRQLFLDIASAMRTVQKGRKRKEVFAQHLKTYSDSNVDLLKDRFEKFMKLERDADAQHELMGAVIHGRILEKLGAFANHCRVAKENMEKRERVVKRFRQKTEELQKAQATAQINEKAVQKMLRKHRTARAAMLDEDKMLVESVENFERQKVADLKLMTAEYVHAQLEYHARCLEIYTKAYPVFARLDDDKAIKDWLKRLEPLKKEHRAASLGLPNNGKSGKSAAANGTGKKGGNKPEAADTEDGDDSRFDDETSDQDLSPAEDDAALDSDDQRDDSDLDDPKSKPLSASALKQPAQPGRSALKDSSSSVGKLSTSSLKASTGSLKNSKTVTIVESPKVPTASSRKLTAAAPPSARKPAAPPAPEPDDDDLSVSSLDSDADDSPPVRPAVSQRNMNPRESVSKTVLTKKPPPSPKVPQPRVVTAAPVAVQELDDF